MKNLFLVLLLMMASLGCTDGVPGISKPAEDFSGHAAATLAKSVVFDNAPAPKPVNPSSDICENCKGVGKIGDGRTMLTCTECNGTGKKKKSEPAQLDQASVDMIVNAVMSKMADVKPAQSGPTTVDLSEDSIAKVKTAVVQELTVSAEQIIKNARNKLGLDAIDEKPPVDVDDKEPENPFPSKQPEVKTQPKLGNGVSLSDKQAYVAAYGFTGCVYCEEFKNNLMPNLKAARWTVDYFNELEPQSGVSYPVIEVHGWGLKKTHVGRMTMADFTKICDELKQAAGK